MQQWGRWYSQAPVSGRPVLNCRNKKKGSSPTGRKKTPTYRTAHPPTTDNAVHPPPTHRPNLYYIQQNSSAAVRTSEQQCSSAYSSIHLVRGAQLVSWFLRNRKQQKKYSHVQNGPPTHHGQRSAPSTHSPTKPLLHTAEQQCSSTYIRTAVQQYVQHSRTAVQQYVHQNSCAAVHAAGYTWYAGRS